MTRLVDRDADQSSNTEGDGCSRETEQDLTQTVFNRMLARHHRNRGSYDEKPYRARGRTDDYAGRTRKENIGKDGNDRAEGKKEK